ncbi:unnamed protein product [Trifolium pratense]|uniref:Uncharacterized protein n=1 Tax=Trifolium pratense TaxID=57577 RepID=A0ACB0KB51_TRIPR|nr:unnamed protein product [Trifolium pratense]
MGTSARLEPYSQKLCLTVILMLEFSAEIVFCFRSYPGRSCDFFESDTSWRCTMLQRLSLVRHSPLHPLRRI